MAWRLAKGLIRLREQVNAMAPARSKVSDGSIGDAAHSSRTSDHNPDSRGIVCAVDLTHDPAGGLDCHSLEQALITDPRTKYVIFTGRIWKARTGKWERYTGPNKHNHHLHISVQAATADDDHDWVLAGEVPRHPTLQRGDRGSLVRELQQALGVDIDGKFGPHTEHAVRVFQLTNHLPSTGIVDPATWLALNIAD